MKIKNIFIVIFSMMLMTNPVLAMAAPIDNIEIYDPAKPSDEVIFTADENKGSQNGAGTGTTETETNQSTSTQNTSLTEEQQRFMQLLIQKNQQGKKAVYIPGQSVVIYENSDIPWKDLIQYIDNGLKYETIPDLYAISHKTSSAGIHPTDNIAKTLDAIQQDIAKDVNAGDNLPLILGTYDLNADWLSGIDTSAWPDELKKIWPDILNGAGPLRVRTDIVNGGMIDWPYHEIRYEVLKAYVTSVGMEELINTTNIIEYRISGEENQKIISKQPVGEYKWEICDRDGNVLKTTHTYGRTLRLSFSEAGTYYVRAYQKHFVTRADIVSTNQSEYWLISETKQLLWHRQREGKQYTYNRNVAEEYIQTNYIQQDITEDMIQENWIAALDPHGKLMITEGFQVERLK